MIELKIFKGNDFKEYEEIAAIRNDCREFLLDNKEITSGEVLRFFVDRVRTGKEYFYFIWHEKDYIKNIIGYINLKNIDKETQEIGIKIKKEFRGQGLGYKALLAIYEKIALNLILVAEIKSDNETSKKLFSKAGFERIEDKGGYEIWSRKSS